VGGIAEWDVRELSPIGGVPDVLAAPTGVDTLGKVCEVSHDHAPSVQRTGRPVAVVLVTGRKPVPSQASHSNESSS
jgi:hypothetical protein